MLIFLYSLIAVELFTGGGGRLLELGPVTLRMVLFATALLAAAFVQLRCKDPNKWSSLAMLLVLGFFCAHLPSVLVGLARGASLQDIFTDLSPLFFWLMAPFFALVLRCEHMVRRTAVLLQWSAVLMALGYLVVVAALTVGIVGVEGFHAWAEKTGEISFRNEHMFFYKGFLYLGIGIVFLAAQDTRGHGVWLTAMVVALTLTLTRGFVLATSLATVLLLVAMGRKRALVLALCVIAGGMYAVWVFLPSLDQGGMLTQRGISNSIRIHDLQFMRTHLNLSSLVFGEGMGSYINGRLSVENSYLTILWKMGGIALAFWMLPLGIALYYFREVQRVSSRYRLACAFFFGLILVYVQTGSNPYLNNPIGLSFVLIAIFSLRTLAESDAERALLAPVSGAHS